jgi:hypothetical protein
MIFAAVMALKAYSMFTEFISNGFEDTSSARLKHLGDKHGVKKIRVVLKEDGTCIYAYRLDIVFLDLRRS